MKAWFVACTLVLFGHVSFGQNAQQTWSCRFADTIMLRYTPTINAMTGKNWEYSNSIILHGIEKVYKWVNDVSYRNYIKTYVDGYLNSTGTTNSGWGQSLDKVHPGILCLFLYEQLKSNASDSLKYKNASKFLRDKLIPAGYRRSGAGFYDHKISAQYQDVVMLDGIYMAHPFLVKYGRIFNDNAALDTATSQTLRIADILYVPSKHLLKHAYHYGTATNVTWDDANGISSQYWSRAMGWYTMALVDMLKYLPSTHPKYNAMKTLLANIAIGIRDTQDPTTGLWRQVMDQGSSGGNYIETSGSAMFIYSIKTAVDSGWINNSFLTVAQNGWAGLQSYITTYGGTLAGGSGPRITSFAPAMSVQDNFAGYTTSNPATSAPTPNSGSPSGTQNPHGYAAVLMAASAMEFPLHTLPVKFGYFTATRFGNNVMLKWNNTDVDEGVSYYEVQRSSNGSDFTVVGNINSDGKGNYQWLDINVPGTVAWYRIRAIDKDGKVYFSKIEMVKLKSVESAMTISPNPVTGRVLKFRFENLRPDTYKLRILNSAGRTVSVTTIVITGDGNSSQTMALPSSVRKGVYYVRLEAEGVIIIKSILVQ